MSPLDLWIRLKCMSSENKMEKKLKTITTDYEQKRLNSTFGIDAKLGELYSDVFDRICIKNNFHSYGNINPRRKVTAINQFISKGNENAFYDKVIKVYGRSQSQRIHKLNKKFNKEKQAKETQEQKALENSLLNDPVSTLTADEVNKRVICNLPSSKFYRTKEWRFLRYRVLEVYGSQCCKCGATPQSGTVLHVDHIMPRYIYPEYALEFSNLQVLCEDCNVGKYYDDSGK